MEGWSREKIFQIFHKELLDLAQIGKNHEQEIQDSLDENLDFLRRMVSQVPDANDGPLLPKTPKVNRKVPAQRIETIHEDELVEFEITRSVSNGSEQIKDDKVKQEQETDDEDDNMSARRSRRTAAKKAATSIKRQQSSLLNTKLRRSSGGSVESKKRSRKGTVKELSSSEDEQPKPSKSSKARKTSSQSKKIAKELTAEMKNSTFVVETKNQLEVKETNEQRVSTSSKRKRNETKSTSPKRVNEAKITETDSEEPAAKKANLVDESVEKSSCNDTLESSIYEDAIGKPAPIHNSTKIIDTTVTIDRKSRNSLCIKELPISKKAKNNAPSDATILLKRFSNEKQKLGPAQFENLDTDDENEVGCTPEVKCSTKSVFQQGNRPAVQKAVKNSHKLNALFSPYGAESVKKRVQAFEQASSPKLVEADAPTRVTRTKTRAMAKAAASESSVQPVQPVKSIAQKLARKSLAKAKRISLARQIKDLDESKENEHYVTETIKAQKLLSINEKLFQKQQLKVTPMGKSRLQQPMSVNRVYHTPLSVQPLSSHPKAMSASRANIITGMDSFLQSTKQAQQLSLAEKIEEKKKKLNDEDARRKKDEALRAHAEEKKRKREEKELKNKMAREAKEKIDREKRLKAEKEREEKAKLALQIQEKQREEAEKKRLLQLQRAQEKEERRKQEEQLRLQRLHEQEEMERQLAEQKRKEQEAAERQHQRRLAEAKAQQQAVAEAAKIKAHYQAKQGKQLNSTYNNPKPAQAPTSYKIESEPGESDDPSDNEEAPKHAVPIWAQAHMRKGKLALQQYLPPIELYRYFDTRKCTPDLTKIFIGIDKKRLKRTSSANWKTPPRYSMMYRE